MNKYKKVISLAQLITRQMSSNASEVPSAKFARLKDIQNKLGKVDEEVPSYLKGGVQDRILFGINIVGVAIGLGMAAEVLYTLSYPPSPSD